MQAQTRMYIGSRNRMSRRGETEEFHPIVTIEMGVIREGQTLSLVHTREGFPVRLYDRTAKEFKTNQSGRPLVALDATIVQAAVEADLEKPDPLTTISYHLALASLKILEEKSLGSIEVVFESYLSMRVAG